MTKVLAAGPYVGGPMTIPRRCVLLRWPDNQLSVHWQDAHGNNEEGTYYKPDRLEEAVRKWAATAHLNIQRSLKHLDLKDLELAP